MRPRKDSQRGCRLVKGIRNTAGDDTTSEPQGRNALTGAPVKASMSGSILKSNQGGTVEYVRIPPLIFQGVGIFYTFPRIKRRKNYVRRKPVHL